MRNTTFSTLASAGVTLELPLAETSWAAQPKRELEGPKKEASRARRTLIKSAPLENGGRSGPQN